MITLRGYQDTAVGQVRGYYGRGKRRVLLVMPTGAGKTIVFSYITKATETKGKRVLVLAHRKELLTQCGDKLRKNEVYFGYLNPSFTPQPFCKVQVGTMQTVIKRMTKLNFTPDLIIVDECHRAMGKTYQDILAYYPNARVLGVTATPVRGDGKPLGEFFDAMVVGPSIKELIKMGALVPPRTFGPEKYLDFSKVKMVKQEDGSYDYSLKGAAEVVDSNCVIGDAVERYKNTCPTAPAVVFCNTVNEAKTVAADFRKAGFNFVHVDGTMKDKERDEIFEQLREGSVHGITSVDLVTEGFDAPILQCAIMLRPTRSEGLYLQMAGRVLRPHPGKSVAYILDHVGVSIRHRVVTADRHWTLETQTDEKKRGAKEKLIKVKQCPKCFIVHEPAPCCPECGHSYEVAERQIEKIKGNLVEITEEQEQFIDFLSTLNPTPSETRKLIANAKTFNDLYNIQVKYGFKKTWAKKVWASRNKKAQIV